LQLFLQLFQLKVQTLATLGSLFFFHDARAEPRFEFAVVATELGDLALQGIAEALRALPVALGGEAGATAAKAGEETA
jgi:hypothetical protein